MHLTIFRMFVDHFKIVHSCIPLKRYKFIEFRNEKSTLKIYLYRNNFTQFHGMTKEITNNTYQTYTAFSFDAKHSPTKIDK